MKEKLKKLMASAQELLNIADTNQGGIMTEEQETEFSGYETQIKSIKAQIDRASSLAALNEGFECGIRITRPESVIVGKDRLEDDRKGGYSCLGEYALDVMSAVIPGSAGPSDKLKILAAPSGQATSRGGDESFQVPVDFREAIWQNVYGTETSFDIFSLFNPTPTNRSTVQIPKDESTPWGTTGVQAYWGSESGQMTGSNPATKMDLVPVDFLYAFVLATEDLLADLPMFNNRITQKSGDAIRFKASNAIVSGDGIGKPKGFMNGGSLVTVAKETSQSTASIVAQNIANMYSRLISPQRGFWLVSPDAFPQLITMTLNNNPIWIPEDGGFTQKPNGLLLGQPMYLTEHNSTLGTVGDIMFVNPDGYLLLQRSSAPEYAESIHLYFDYNIRAFRWIFRMGGQPYSNAAVSTFKTSTTRSHFVTLATRP